VFYLVTGGRMEQVSPSWLRARYGVGPAAYPAFAALRGDASDCLPGIKGIGAVTAARLLAAYESVEDALADPAGVARLLGAWVAEALVTQRATYELNRELMAIRDDVALEVAACTRRLDARVVASVLEDLGAPDLTGRFLGSFTQLGRVAWRAAPTAS
jgi:5'-3' exonuclease